MQPDAEIVTAVLRGEVKDFAVLVTRYERAVWATSWRVLRDDHAASDAAQEAFFQAYKRLADLRQPSLFGVWLLQIARRESIRLAKRRQRDPVRSIDEAAPEQHVLGDDAATRLSVDAQELFNAVARLPEHERIVVVQHYLDGRSMADVAAGLGRPIGTVTKQLSRAIQRLKHNAKEVIQ
jgi:RNA polymerase sigma-70 factor, ECF subfamily